MTLMIDHDILKSLQDAARTAVLASTDPTIPIAYIDVNFDPSEDAAETNGKYLELVFIPNNVENDTWGDERTYQGMFRMILHWPKSISGGPYPPMQLLSSICAYFSKDRKLGDVQVTNLPVFTGMLAAGHENLYPASLRYQRYQP